MTNACLVITKHLSWWYTLLEAGGPPQVLRALLPRHAGLEDLHHVPCSVTVPIPDQVPLLQTRDSQTTVSLRGMLRKKGFFFGFQQIMCLLPLGGKSVSPVK